MMKVMITGTKGYMANALKNWMDQNYRDLEAELLSVRGEDWKQTNFKGVDTLIHTAGLVHKSEKDYSQEDYHRINRDLTYALACKARKEGVKHFIFISTMAVYGAPSSCFRNVEIGPDTPVEPKSKYGISKYQAEQKLKDLECDDFRISIVRPPFVYGKGCPGNYETLRKLTLKLGMIPRLPNRKSMIYISNLCECICKICIRRLPGVFCPQNDRIVSTYEMSQLICSLNHKKAVCTRILNPFVKLGSLAVRKIGTAFGSNYYSPELSDMGLPRAEYALVGFEDSMRETEI